MIRINIPPLLRTNNTKETGMRYGNGFPAILLGLAMTMATVATGAEAPVDEAAPGDSEEAARLDQVTVTGELSRYSALKSDTPILETARSVSIETAAVLQDQGALELADAYLYSAGVFGEAYGFATRGDWVKVQIGRAHV